MQVVIAFIALYFLPVVTMLIWNPSFERKALLVYINFLTAWTIIGWIYAIHLVVADLFKKEKRGDF